MSTGFLYIASGKKYIKEAENSAKSVYEHMPDANITLATDTVDYESEYFDDVIDIPKEFPHSAASLIHPKLMPYEKTIRLDTDTYLCQPVDELFDLLNKHDIAFTLSPGQNSVPDLPSPWIEFNGGVIAYKRSEATKELFSEWNDRFEKLLETEGIERGQPSLAQSVYHTDVNYFVLPREYNCRVPRFGYLGSSVKIIHGRSTIGLESLSEKLNSDNGPRVYWPKIRHNMKADLNVEIRSQNEKKPMFLIFRFKKSINRYGLKHALKNSYYELKKIIK